MRFQFDQGLPAIVTATKPLVVTQTGQTYNVSVEDGAELLTGDVWLWQLKSALQSSNNLHAVDAAVSADPGDAFVPKWTGGGRTSQGDTISNFIKSALSWTDAQMANLYTLAGTITS